VEDIIRKILRRDQDTITLATGKTPSGHIHVGILREIIICDSIKRILEKKETKEVRFFLFLDSLDAAKRFPDYIKEGFQNKHLGKPFSFIPCPYEECSCESYAHHFGNELISTFKEFGIENEIIWTHELYQTEKMQKRIELALDNTKKIKKILRKYIIPTLDDNKKKSFLEMQKDWMPVMAICENCNRIQTQKKDGSIQPNRIISYDSENQTGKYKCPACEYEDELSLSSGRLKLNWRVDWPAKWDIYKTTCEPAGKDHCVKGGSYDTGLEICKKIFNYKGPIKVPYEWLRLGERDMKTSKGIIFTPKKYLEIADPEIFRMLILRTDPMKHISFRIEELPQYYNYFTTMKEAYFSNINLVSEEREEFFKYLYPLVKIGEDGEDISKEIPFNSLIFLSQLQNILSTNKLFEKAKEITNHPNLESIITQSDFKDLLDRTKNWIDEIKKILKEEKDPKIKRNISKKVSIFSVPNEVPEDITNQLDEKQKEAIDVFKNYLKGLEKWEAEKIQNKIFTMAKEDLNISPKKLFQAIYLLIFGKKYGPRLGPFLELLDKKWLLNRLEI
jgi:lysyl-tRNA synthetase class 1